MTYCVALRLNRGLVFAADTRTSAGNDNVAMFRKLHYWRKTGERVIVLTSAGNLAVTQSVISLLNEQLVGGTFARRREPVHRAVALSRGPAGRRCHARGAQARRPGAGRERLELQRQFHPRRPDRSEVPRLFHIYPEGNFIEATDDTPYLPDRRAQVRQADHRPRGAAQHAAGRGGQARAAVVRIPRCARICRSACRSTC